MKTLYKFPCFLSCTAIALAPLAAQELPAPEVYARAVAGLKENSATAPAGDISADASDASIEGISATSSAKAKTGTLTARVECGDSSDGEHIYGSTNTSWRDTMTINANGRAGQAGIVTLNFRVKGVPIFQTNDGNVGVEVNTGVSVDTLGAIQEFRRAKTISPSGSLGDDYLGKVQSFDFSFTYGEPFSLTALMVTSATTSGTPFGVGFTGINAEWDWLGLTNFRTWDGSNPDSIKRVLNVTVNSESKTNYLRPIGVNYPTVTILSDLGELTEKPAQTGTITVRLNKPAPSKVRIDLAYSGKANLGKDYSTTKPSHVTIEKGVSQATFTIQAIDDAFIEKPQALSIRVLPGVGYGLGNPQTAAVTILSDE